MAVKKILWLEDQYEDFATYRSPLFRAGYLVESVQSVSEAEKKIAKDGYIAFIFDIKVLPGDDKKWLELDERKRKEKPHFDSYLGIELLRSLLKPDNRKLDPMKVIVFSVVHDEEVRKELISFNIPEEQIVYKSDSTLMTLPKLLEKMQNAK